MHATNFVRAGQSTTDKSEQQYQTAESVTHQGAKTTRNGEKATQRLGAVSSEAFVN